EGLRGGLGHQRLAGVGNRDGLQRRRLGLATLLESREPAQLRGTLARAGGDACRTIDSRCKLRDLRALLAHHVAALRETALGPIELLLERAQPSVRVVQVDDDRAEQAQSGSRQDEPTRA